LCHLAIFLSLNTTKSENRCRLRGHEFKLVQHLPPDTLFGFHKTSPEDTICSLFPRMWVCFLVPWAIRSLHCVRFLPPPSFAVIKRGCNLDKILLRIRIASLPWLAPSNLVLFISILFGLDFRFRPSTYRFEHPWMCLREDPPDATPHLPERLLLLFCLVGFVMHKKIFPGNPLTKGPPAAPLPFFRSPYCFHTHTLPGICWHNFFPLALFHPSFSPHTPPHKIGLRQTSRFSFIVVPLLFSFITQTPVSRHSLLRNVNVFQESHGEPYPQIPRSSVSFLCHIPLRQSPSVPAIRMK